MRTFGNSFLVNCILSKEINIISYYSIAHILEIVKTVDQVTCCLWNSKGKISRLWEVSWKCVSYLYFFLHKKQTIRDFYPQFSCVSLWFVSKFCELGAAWGKVELSLGTFCFFPLPEFIVFTTFPIIFAFLLTRHRSVCCNASWHHSSHWWRGHWMSHGLAFTFLWIQGISLSYEGILPWWGQVDHCS